jgi:hypothetical protein
MYLAITSAMFPTRWATLYLMPSLSSFSLAGLRAFLRLLLVVLVDQVLLEVHPRVP